MTEGARGKIVQLRRTYRGEEEWFELLGELTPSGLRRALIAAGVRPAVAGNLVWFLEDQVMLDRHLSEQSRKNYRHQLAELDVEKVRTAASKLAIPGQFNSPAA